jgi:hypothetical protein
MVQKLATFTKRLDRLDGWDVRMVASETKWPQHARREDRPAVPEDDPR